MTKLKHVKKKDIFHPWYYIEIKSFNKQYWNILRNFIKRKLLNIKGKGLKCGISK